LLILEFYLNFNFIKDTHELNDLGAIIVAWEEAQAEREEKELRTLLLFANQASLVLETSAEGKEEKAETKRKRSSLPLDLD
jgi:hypothetical protein